MKLLKTTVMLCRALVRGADWTDAVGKAARRRQRETQAALWKKVDEPLRKDGFAPEVLRAALYFVSSYATFAPALEAAIKFAGRANYCPVLVGAIAGARWGG